MSTFPAIRRINVIKRTFTLAFFVMCIMCIMVSTAQAQEKEIRVRFAKGATSRTYKDAVYRSINAYTVSARRGQTMTVKIISPENLAAFDVTRSNGNNKLPTKIAPPDQTKWTGVLPASGDYFIAVVSDRGGSEYTITISVK